MTVTSNHIVLALAVIAAVCIYAAVRLIRNWDLACESVELFPENVRRLVVWHKRRALRRLYKLLGAVENIKAR